MNETISANARALWNQLQEAVAELGEVSCQSNPDLFFANYGEDDNAEWQRAQAVRMCMDCPLVDLCRDYSFAAEEEHGIWGGFRPLERMSMIRALRRTQARAAKRDQAVA